MAVKKKRGQAYIASTEGHHRDSVGTSIKRLNKLATQGHSNRVSGKNPSVLVRILYRVMQTTGPRYIATANLLIEVQNQNCTSNLFHKFKEIYIFTLWNTPKWHFKGSRGQFRKTFICKGRLCSTSYSHHFGTRIFIYCLPSVQGTTKYVNIEAFWILLHCKPSKYYTKISKTTNSIPTAH